MFNYWFSCWWHIRLFEVFFYYFISVKLSPSFFMSSPVNFYSSPRFLYLVMYNCQLAVRNSAASYGQARLTHIFLIRRPLLAIFDLFVSCLSVKLLWDCHCWVLSNKNRASIAFYFSGIAFWCTFTNTAHIFFVITLRPTARLSLYLLRQYFLIPLALHMKNAVPDELSSTV